MTTKKTLCITSYNCEYANEIRLPFFQYLLEKSDFLLLQEHGLYKSKFDWFDRLGDISYHGVSAMDEKVLLRGRPHGGAVILWKNSLKNKVTAVSVESTRLTAVTIETHAGNLLLLNVYMPCDDNQNRGNVVEYNDILNEICLICNSVDASYLCIMGDFNTEFSRNNAQTRALETFLVRNDLNCYSLAAKEHVPFTYISKINGMRSLIDHCVISENLSDIMTEYCSIDSVDNASDHLAIQCTLSFDMEHVESAPVPTAAPSARPCWSKATQDQLREYGEALDERLLDIPIPFEAYECGDAKCINHSRDIDNFHDNIVRCLTNATNASIPVPRKQHSAKVTPGWNEFVENHFRNALFWYKLWVENGRPPDGILADIRRSTRARYHQARKKILKEKDIISSSNLIRSLNNESSKDFWTKIRKCNGSKMNVSSCVDNQRGESEICNVFKEKFQSLYNSVPYNVTELGEMMQQIESCISDVGPNEFEISALDVSNAIKNLKIGKNDSWLPHTSDSIIHGTDTLNQYLTLLFNMMLKHGHSPYGMLVGTMVPLPKGKWKSKRDSENYRAITLSSLFGKLLDLIILHKEGEKLKTDNLQFGYKKGISTTMCTTVLRETVSYYTTKGTSVYGLMLDATKAFDRVNYCKLFKILLFRDVSPLICRLLLNMYTKQSLRVRWSNIFSENFDVSNGVKQGGILSPILFSIYMDGLIANLRLCGMGCRISRYFVGVIVYADDVVLLAPSVRALRTMLGICLKYADEYDVLFNDKSKLITFPAKNVRPYNPEIVINGKQIEVVTEMEHLGHVVLSDILKGNALKCVADFNTQCNAFLGKFNNHSSKLRNFLFGKYCTSFYGSQYLPLHDDSTASLCRAWRCGVRRVWRLPYRAHCDILPHLADSLPPELILEKRSIAFVKQMLSSSNVVVKAVSKISCNQVHSILGSNIRHLRARYDMDVKRLYSRWERMIDDNAVRSATQVAELCEWRDTGDETLLTRSEIKDIIAAIVTE